MGGNAKHVGGDAETFLHGVEKVFGLTLRRSGVESGDTGHGDLLVVCAFSYRWRLVTVRKMRYVGRWFNWPESTISVSSIGIIAWTVLRPGPSSSRLPSVAASPRLRGISADRLRR